MDKVQDKVVGAPVIRMENVGVGALADLNVSVIDGINWSVQAQDFWAIAGLQGSGKSDLLAMTASLMPPRTGSYWLFGEAMPIFDESRLPTRLRLGMVFDGGQVFNHLTVRENVALPLRYHRDLSKGDAAAQVQNILDATELGPWADSTPGAMGRNWQKRAGLARALSLQPEVLVVDNPLAGLDLRHASWWLKFLDELHRGHPLLSGRPVTMVVTTADLRPWKGRARQFAVLRDKKLIVLGGWEQIEAANEELVLELLPK
jgi:ABC-type transporter Mla maintaining outer membrane lipid asymmetry ATPase subunit MlaF